MHVCTYNAVSCNKKCLYSTVFSLPSSPSLTIPRGLVSAHVFSRNYLFWHPARGLLVLTRASMPQTVYVPPGAPAPNYVNPPVRPPAAQVTSIIFIILITFSLILRLYTRVYISVNLGLDDAFAISGTVCCSNKISTMVAILRLKNEIR